MRRDAAESWRSTKKVKFVRARRKKKSVAYIRFHSIPPSGLYIISKMAMSSTANVDENLHEILAEGVSTLHVSSGSSTSATTTTTSTTTTTTTTVRMPTPPPIIWQDASDMLRAGAATLGSGELLHDARFSLYDAMAAIELMDPKMDAGMLPLDNNNNNNNNGSGGTHCGGSAAGSSAAGIDAAAATTEEEEQQQQQQQPTQRALSLSAAVDRGLRTKNFSCSQLCAIFDDQIVQLSLWLRGNTLAQTVLTCLYLHDTSVLAAGAPELKTVCEAQLVLVRHVQQVLMFTQVYAEEDCHLDTCGFDLASAQSYESMLTELADLRDDLKERRRRAEEEEENDEEKVKSRGSGGDDNVSCVVKGDTTDAARAAWQHRVSLLLELLYALVTTGEPASVQKARQALTACLTRLTSVVSTLPHSASSITVQPRPFEPHVNGHLLAPIPMRDLVPVSREEAYDVLRSEIEHVQRATDVVSCGGGTLEDIERFLRRLGRSVSGTHGLIGRAKAFTYIFPSELVLGRIPFAALLRQSMVAFNGNPVASTTLAPVVAKTASGGASAATLSTSVDGANSSSSSSSSFSLASSAPAAAASSSDTLALPEAQAQIFGNFVEMCAITLKERLRAMCHNRARTRRKLIKLLPDLGRLQQEANELDAILQTTPESGHTQPLCGTWLLAKTIHVQVDMLLLGLELDLYATHELHMVLWYTDSLYKWLQVLNDGALKHRVALRQAEEEAVKRANKAAKAAKGNGGKKKKKKKKKKAVLDANPSTEWMCHAVHSYMVRGLTRCLEACLMTNRLCEPVLEFTSPLVRYRHRFGPFLHLTSPPPVTYTEYTAERERYTQEVPVDVSFGLAAKFFGEAVKQAEIVLATGLHESDREELVALVRVAKTNMVTCRVAAAGHRAGEDITAKFNFSYHLDYPVVEF